MGGRSTKKYSRKRKLNEKTNSYTLINPKKCSCYGLKKNSYEYIDYEKNSCGTTIRNTPPPPPQLLPITYISVIGE